MVGRPTSVPAKPPTKRKLLKIISSTAVPRASVAMARLMPRERTAGSAKSAPSGTVATMPASSASGNGQPHTATVRPAISAPNPASANWARDSCPAYPVMTTTDNRMIPMANVVTNASCHCAGTALIRNATATTMMISRPGRMRPLPIEGRRCRK